MSAMEDFTNAFNELQRHLTDPEQISEINDKAAELRRRPEDAVALDKFIEIAASWEYQDDEWKEVGGTWTVQRVAEFFDHEDSVRNIGIMKAEEAFEKRATAPSPPPPAPKPAAAPSPAPSAASVKAVPVDDKEKLRLREELERALQDRDEAIAGAAEAESARAEAQARLDAMADPAEYERELNRVRGIMDEAQRAAAESNREVAEAAEHLAAEAEAAERAAAEALGQAARREEAAFQEALADRLRTVANAGADDHTIQERNRERRTQEHHEKHLDQILDHRLHAAEERLRHCQHEEDKWQKHTLRTEARGNSRARVVLDQNMRRGPRDLERTYDPVTQAIGPRRPLGWWDRIRDGFADLFF